MLWQNLVRLRSGTTEDVAGHSGDNFGKSVCGSEVNEQMLMQVRTEMLREKHGYIS